MYVPQGTFKVLDYWDMVFMYSGRVTVFNLFMSGLDKASNKQLA